MGAWGRGYGGGVDAAARLFAGGRGCWFMPCAMRSAVMVASLCELALILVTPVLLEDDGVDSNILVDIRADSNIFRC